MLDFAHDPLRNVVRLRGVGAPPKRPARFLHIGKTGGTAVKDALGRIAEAGGRPVTLCEHAVTLRDTPAGEDVIFAVRDPLDRFVSGFYSRLRRGKPRYDFAWTPAETEAFARFRSPNALGLALASRLPWRRRAAERALCGIQHVRDTYATWFESPDYLRARAGDVLFVLRQQHLAADFDVLRARLGAADWLRLPTDDVRAHRNPAGLDRSLAPRAAAALRDWYAEDYRFMAVFETLGRREALAA